MIDADRARIVALLYRIGWPGTRTIIDGYEDEAVIEKHLCKWLAEKKRNLIVVYHEQAEIKWNIVVPVGDPGNGQTFLLALLDACEKEIGR